MTTSGPFKPFNTLKASEVVYTHIKNMILSGEIPAGEKLPSENELSEIFGKSRPTIREALRMLESNQYITIQRGKGATVNPITTYTIERTLDDLIGSNTIDGKDVLHVRNVCESLSAKLAAVRRTDADIKAMRIALNASEGFEKYLELMPTNKAFHQAISRAAGNGMLALVNDMTYSVSDEMHTNFFKTLSVEDEKAYCQKVVHEHREIFDAIVAQDAEAAADAMLTHLISAMETM